MRKSTKKLITNLKAKVRRFNKQYGADYKVGFLSSPDDVRKENVKFSQYRTNIKFERDTQKYISRLEKYNRKVPLSEISKRFTALPRTPAQLKKYTKIIDNIEKGQINKAEKLAGVKKKDPKNDSLFKRSATLTKDTSYKDQIFLRTSIREASKVGVEGFDEMLREGGLPLLKDLSRNGFGIWEFAESQTEAGTNEAIIEAKIQAVKKYLSPENKKLVEKFFK